MPEASLIMFILKNKFIFFSLSAVLVAGAIVGLFVQGLNRGIDFAGGSLLELSYETAPEITELQDRAAELAYPVRVQPFAETGVIIRTKDLTETERQEMVALFAVEENPSTVERFNSVGPSIGRELSRKAIIALVVVMIAIIFFVAWAFRSMTDDEEEREKRKLGPSSWLYGIIAVVALIHDILIPTGIFIWLGLEVNSLFVVGLLSILGLSVNDTIVVFDRIREHVRDAEASPHKSQKTFAQMVGESISQTIGRSIFTSLTLLVALAALYFAGPAATQDLAFVMILGTLVGTYSSIFLASPLLVLLAKKKKA